MARGFCPLIPAVGSCNVHLICSGSSIKAGIISSQIRKELGLEDMPGNLILTERTIRNVAAALGRGRGSELRGAPTRRLAGQETTRAFGALAVDRLLESRMNASDLELGSHMPHRVPKTRLPYPLYLMLSLVLSTFASLVGALVISILIGLMAVFQYSFYMNGGFWNFLIAPAIYMGLMVTLFFLLPAFKWILFPRRMQPGVYPLYGWTYLR